MHQQSVDFFLRKLVERNYNSIVWEDTWHDQYIVKCRQHGVQPEPCSAGCLAQIRIHLMEEDFADIAAGRPKDPFAHPCALVPAYACGEPNPKSFMIHAHLLGIGDALICPVSQIRQYCLFRLSASEFVIIKYRSKTSTAGLNVLHHVGTPSYMMLINHILDWGFHVAFNSVELSRVSLTDD